MEKMNQGDRMSAAASRGGRVFIPEKGLWVSLWNYRAWGLLPCRLLLQSHCVATEPQCLVSRHSSQRALHTRCPNSQSLSRGRLALSLARSQAQLLRPAFLKPGVGQIGGYSLQPTHTTHTQSSAHKTSGYHSGYTSSKKL